MNVCGLIPEGITPLNGADLAEANGGMTAQRIWAMQCASVAVVVYLKAGAGDGASRQATIAIKAYDAASGGNATTLKLDGVYIAKGAPGLAAGTGRYAFTKLEDVSSFTTDAADGDVELMLIFTVQTRQLTGSKHWLQAEISGLSATRFGAISYLRVGENAGPEATRNNYTGVYP